MDRKSWERRHSDIALYQTNQQLEAQSLELYQASRWADQAQRENSRSFGELSTQNRIYQEHHARDCQEIEELRRTCCEQADRVRQLRIDELSTQQERKSLHRDSAFVPNSGTAGHCESVNDEKEFHDPETASTSGNTMRHGEGLRREPQSSTIPTPRFTRNYETWNPFALYWRNLHVPSLSQDRVQQRFLEQITLVSKVFPPDRVHLRFVEEVFTEIFKAF